MMFINSSFCDIWSKIELLDSGPDNIDDEDYEDDYEDNDQSENSSKYDPSLPDQKPLLRAEPLKTKLKYYKMLYILNNLYNESWSVFLIPGFKVIIMIDTILPLYGTIRYFISTEYLGFIWCPMMAAFLGLIMTVIPPIFASIQELSWPILGIAKEIKGHTRPRNSVSSGSINQSLEVRLLRRVLWSYPPLTCKAGVFYTFDTNTGLTCLDIILQMSAYFLVAN